MVRIKNRWLLVQIRFEDEDLTILSNPTQSNAGTPIQLQLLRAIRESIQTSFGDLGSGALGGSIAIRYYSPVTHNAIIRCSRLGVKHVWSAITLCNRLQSGKRVRMIVKHTSGTIRKVQQATIRADRKEIERLFSKRKELAKQHSLSILHNKDDGDFGLDQTAKDALLQSKRDIEAIEQ